MTEQHVTSKKGSKLLKANIEAFFNHLSEGHTVREAAKRAKVNLTTFYERRKWDDVFDAQWLEAVEQGTQVLEQEARRRAVEGVTEPVFYKGMICGDVQKYSDTLLIFLLKARRPAVYRERVEHSGEVTIHEQSDFDREIATLLDEMAARSKAPVVCPSPNGSVASNGKKGAASS